MNFFTFTKLGRTLLLAAVVAVGLLSVGCGGDDGGDDNPANNNSNNNNGGDGSLETVTIGGKKWMKKNLNVEMEDSWCYNNSPDNCAKYGRLYTWEAAKSACQSVGMRLPTNAEWDALVKAAGGSSTAGKKLKSKSGWYNNGNGTDNYGFSALPGGSGSSNGYFNGVGYNGIWWTATEDAGGGAYYRNMYDYNDYVGEYHATDDRYSVRCVKDA